MYKNYTITLDFLRFLGKRIIQIIVFIIRFMDIIMVKFIRNLRKLKLFSKFFLEINYSTNKNRYQKLCFNYYILTFLIQL